MNSLSPQGQLPLGLALISRSTAIAQTLVQNGKADVNAYDAEVSTTMLIKKGKKTYFMDDKTLFRCREALY